MPGSPPIIVGMPLVALADSVSIVGVISTEPALAPDPVSTATVSTTAKTRPLIA